MLGIICLQICEKLNKQGWEEEYATVAEQAIAHGDGQLVTYDNVRSIKAKVDYVKEIDLGGVMVWALDFDDFTGQFCDDGKYPLLTAINEVRIAMYIIQLFVPQFTYCHLAVCSLRLNNLLIIT